ncbi:hypothetical protein ACJX0J_041190, partial [Zea mays]
KMDKTMKPISATCNNDDGVPEETGMDEVFSDLQALKRLYGLLQRLDEASRALLKKLLDDATRRALLKQTNALTATSSSSAIPFSLGSGSPKQMDRATSSSSSFLNNKLPEETAMEQILTDLQALTRLYGLLHSPADENLDEASRALLMKILEDATQEAVRRQAKMLMPSGSLMSPVLERELSTQSHCRTRHADPILRPLASPRPSLLASERSRRLDPQHSTVSRRSGLYADGQRHAAEEPPPLARLASNRSSRTALTARHRPSQEQRCPSLSLHRFPVAGTSRHGTVIGSTRLARRRDSIRHSSGRGDQWSLERSNSNSSSSRRSVSRRELSSLRPSSRLRGRATPRHVGTENSSSVSPFERLDSGLSLSLTSRHGVEHAGRGVATPERSSSSKTVATIQSRIRPSSTPLRERSLHRPAVEAKTLRGRQQDSHVLSEEDTYSSMFSGSGSSSDAASLSASTSPTASPAPAPAPRASATPYYYYPSVATRGIAPPPLYAPEVSRSMRRRRLQERRQEILERRVARLRMLKNKIATEPDGGRRAGKEARRWRWRWREHARAIRRAAAAPEEQAEGTGRHKTGEEGQLGAGQEDALVAAAEATARHARVDGRQWTTAAFTTWKGSVAVVLLLTDCATAHSLPVLFEVSLSFSFHVNDAEQRHE